MHTVHAYERVDACTLVAAIELQSHEDGTVETTRMEDFVIVLDSVAPLLCEHDIKHWSRLL